MMTKERAELERQVKYLTGEIGLSEEAARLRLRDEDLWLLRPDGRFDEVLQGEQGVRAWEEAVTVAHAIGNMVSNGPGTIQANPAITQLVWDADQRAQEALRRARRRIRGRGEAAADETPTSSAWVQILKDAVVQLDTAAADREEEGREDISSRIREVIDALEDELERLTGEEIPRPIRRSSEAARLPGEDDEPEDVPEEEVGEALRIVNQALTEASDVLGSVRPEYLDNPDAYWDTGRTIAAAGTSLYKLRRRRPDSAAEKGAEETSDDPPATPGPRSALLEVNEHLSEAQALLSESVAPTEAQQEAELEARQALADAGRIVARLISRGAGEAGGANGLGEGRSSCA